MVRFSSFSNLFLPLLLPPFFDLYVALPLQHNFILGRIDYYAYWTDSEVPRLDPRYYDRVV